MVDFVGALKSDWFSTDLTNIFNLKRWQFYHWWVSAYVRTMANGKAFLHQGHSECPIFRNINLRTHGSFGMLFTHCVDDVSL